MKTVEPHRRPEPRQPLTTTPALTAGRRASSAACTQPLHRPLRRSPLSRRARPVFRAKAGDIALGIARSLEPRAPSSAPPNTMHVCDRRIVGEERARRTPAPRRCFARRRHRQEMACSEPASPWHALIVGLGRAASKCWRPMSSSQPQWQLVRGTAGIVPKNPAAPTSTPSPVARSPRRPAVTSAAPKSACCRRQRRPLAKYDTRICTRRRWWRSPPNEAKAPRFPTLRRLSRRKPTASHGPLKTR